MIVEELLERKTPIAFIDDVEKEVSSIEEALSQKKIEYKFVDADIMAEKNELIDSLELVFLDLNYNTGYGGSFDEFRCVDLVKSIVPIGKKYYLVFWTKDPDKIDPVIDLLKKENLMPISFITKKKSDYLIGPNKYDVDKLFYEISKEFKDVEDVQEFYGEIIEIQDDHVLLNCLLDKDMPTFQVRRFDLLPFNNYIKIIKGQFIHVVITTKPGSRHIEFFNENSDLSHLFSKPDYFEKLGDISFLKGED